MWGNIIKWFVTLAPGYFFNDIITFAGNTFGVQKDSEGKYPVWFPLVVILGVALIIVLVIGSLFKGKKKLFALAAIGAAAGLDYFFISGSGGSLAVLLTTLTTGVGIVTVANTNYMPRYFAYVAATQLTGVKISYQGGGVILDLDAAGLNALRAARLQGAVTNGTYINLSNGFLSNKNIIWEFTNSAAQTPQVFVGSRESAMKTANPLLLTATKAQILANSGTEFDDFAFLGLPALAAGDVINVLFKDGTVQLFNRADLQFMLQETQTQVNTPDYSLDNFNREIKRVTITSTAAMTAYIQKWQRVGKMVEAQLQ